MDPLNAVGADRRLHGSRWSVMRTVAVAAALLLLACSAAACGGGEGDGEPTAEAVPLEPEEQTVDSRIVECVDVWNTGDNPALWVGQGFFDGMNAAYVGVGENGNCVLAGCAGAQACLVMGYPCPTDEFALLGATYCPIPAMTTPTELAEIGAISVSVAADGTVS